MAEKGGRPQFQPTLEQRLIVQQLRYVGESNKVIAAAINVDPATLKKHFADELLRGYAERRKEVIGSLFDAAQAGNVAASKHLEIMGRQTPAAASRKAQEPKAIGKKEAAELAAKRVTGLFEPQEPPSHLKVVK